MFSDVRSARFVRLSLPLRARSDFSNGFLVAEVLSRYYPSEVALHSFDPAATNVARKRDAWELILKVTRVRASRAHGVPPAERAVSSRLCSSAASCG